MEEYKKLINYLEVINELNYIIGNLLWDMQMSVPIDNKDYHIEQITKLENKVFKLKTSNKYGKLLNNVINTNFYYTLTDEEKRYIKNLLSDYNNLKNIPSDFMNEYSKCTLKSHNVWEEAKKENNFSLFEPYLKKVISLSKKYYEYINYNNEPIYDVMLNDYERNFKNEEIEMLFDELKRELVPFIKKIKQHNLKKLKINYTKDDLLSVAKYLLEYIGIDINKCTIGICEHGFTEKYNKNDVRITFKHTDDPIDIVTTIIHEGGHALFEQNIDENLSKYSNECISHLYALHESQSRFYENVLGKNKNFWIPIYPTIKEMLKLDISLDEFVALLNQVVLSPIRTKADEVTYPLHIIIRYEIEKEIFNNSIDLNNLPEIWNKLTKDYLGIEIKNDSEGLMQDVHWSQGSFGYFPSYLLGTIFDGIFIEVIEKDLGSIDELLRNNKIKDITNYLINNIYKYGGAYNSKEIINKIYKKELSIKPLMNYYKKKYKVN